MVDRSSPDAVSKRQHPCAGEGIGGQLIGIARREKHRAPMERLESGTISEAAGLEGDYRGRKYSRRQITVLAIEDWTAAIAALVDQAGGSIEDSGPNLRDFDWTERRANLLVMGLLLPGGRGSLLQIGEVLLEVTGETTPCARMDEVSPGLRRALASGRRGGVTCRVITGGGVALGDPADVALSLQDPVRRLPG